MSPSHNAPAATEATNGGEALCVRTSPQETHAFADYPDGLHEALSHAEFRTEVTDDTPPGPCPWCAFPRPVLVAVTWTPRVDPCDRVHANACRHCAPMLIRLAADFAAPGHTVVVALISSAE